MPGDALGADAPVPVNSAAPAFQEPGEGGHHAQGGLLKLAVGAIGVVFGDIGTSPIYAFRETFAGHHKLVPDAPHILGVLSLIFWSMMVVVTIKYVSIIMRADNKGEGGSLALLALINRQASRKRWTGGIILLGVFATALFYGDSMITPAMSVLSAVEGLAVVDARFTPWAPPIAIGILVMLFMIQSRGTAKVGLLFGPIMLVYFLVLAVLGVVHIAQDPGVVVALNPIYAVRFFLNEGVAAFLAMGSVVLALTGAEALYADMGHFGRNPNPRVVAVVRPAGADAQLSGTGRDDPEPGSGGGAGADQEPVLLPGVRKPAAAAGAAGDDGHRHRQPGGDFRRLLGDAAGDPARLHPAAAHRPHVQPGGGGRSSFPSSTTR